LNDPLTIKAKLQKIDKELWEIGLQVKPWIPDSPKRDDAIRECWLCIGGAGSAVERSVRALERAINAGSREFEEKA